MSQTVRHNWILTGVEAVGDGDNAEDGFLFGGSGSDCRGGLNLGALAHDGFGFVFGAFSRGVWFRVWEFSRVRG